MDYIDAVISSEGDIALAAERLSTPTQVINAYDVRQGFINEVMQSPARLSGIRALALLQSLQLMAELRNHFVGGLADFSPSELLKALDVVSHSIAELTTPPQQLLSGDSGGNTYNFNGNEVVDRLASRLAQYALPAGSSEVIEAQP